MPGVVPLATAGVGVLLLLAGAGWTALTVNRLVRQRNQVRASWAQVDVQLRRRHDLIPRLVTTVHAYAGQERDALTAATAARVRALRAAATGDPAARAATEQQLGRAVGRLLGRAEAYPAIRADRAFAQLQRELTGTEDRVAYARQFYNLAVQAHRNTIQAAPTTVVARVCGFRSPRYFSAADPARGPVPTRAER